MKKISSGCKTFRKERSLGTDLGDAGDSLYRAYSGTTYPDMKPWNLRKDPELALGVYNASKALRGTNLVIPKIYGRELLIEKRFSRGGMNDVDHYKNQWINRPFLIMWTPSSGLTYYYDYFRMGTTRNLAMAKLAELCESARNTFQPGNDPYFSGRAYWSMRPKFEGEVSLINSVFELKDFKDVMKPRQIYRALKGAFLSPLHSDYAKSFQKLAKDRNVRAKLDEYGIRTPGDLNLNELRRLSHDISGSAATAVLAYNLAYKPTIADVLGIVAQWQTDAMDAQKAFKASGDDGSLSHFSENHRISDTMVPGTGNYTVFQSGSFADVKRTATMRSFYEYKMRDLNSTLVKYWGLAGTAEALWNMLPLSFVLDYVFTVGKALKYMERDNNVMNLTTEYCESVLIKSGDGLAISQDPRVASLIIDGNVLPPRSNTAYHLVSGTEVKRYTRKVMPAYKGPALPKFKVPSTSQALNMLALARAILV